MIKTIDKYPSGYYNFTDNMLQIDITALEPGDRVVVVDDSNYRVGISKCPCDAIVKEVTNYPAVWVIAENKELELYEFQVAVYDKQA